MFDSFYFLHIPKCDGRRFINELVVPLKFYNPDIKFYNNHRMNNSQEITLNGYIHQGWDSRITDSTYVASIMRDPIERAASFYAFSIMSRFDTSDFLNGNKNVYLLKNKFIEFVEKDDHMHNFSSKNFIFDISKKRSILDDSNFFKKENLSLLKDRIKRMNLLIDQKDFVNMDKTIIATKLSEDLKRETFYIPKKESDEYSMPFSKDLYLSLTDSDKGYLRRYFYYDYQIYDNKDIFWCPGK